MANITELRNKIFAATGHKISDDDPVFAVAVLNEIVVGDLLKEQARSLNDQVDKIEAAAAYVSTTAQETVDAYTRASVAAKRELEAQAKASAANAQASINTAVAGLVPAVEKVVAKALADKVKKINLAEDAISYATAGFVISAFFGLGWLIGSRVLTQALAGVTTWQVFMHETALGVVGGIVSTILIATGLGVRNDTSTAGWTMFGVGLITLIVVLLKMSGAV